MCLFVGRYSLSIESAAGASVYSVAATLVCGEVGSYDSNGLFYKHGLTLIPVWISNYMPDKVWGEITYPISKLQRLHRFSLGMDK